MKALIRETGKNMVMVLFLIILAADIILIAGDENGTIGTFEFFILKVIGLFAAYGIYQLGIYLYNKDILPRWIDKLIKEDEQ